MCGIYAYTGKNGRDVVKIVIEGLKKLEYRGYDSAGIAGLNGTNLFHCKEAGKISKLEEEIAKCNFSLDTAIAHTRWATHGEPNRDNAHPHFNAPRSLALVHNGIIENYASLRRGLEKQGVIFTSSTDTEVVAHLIESHYNGDLLDAMQKTSQQLKGAYAITLVHSDFPETLFAVAHDSPLAIGLGKNENFIASDPASFSEYTEEVIFLADNEIAIVTKDTCDVYNGTKTLVEKEIEKLSYAVEDRSKGPYEHYTLKEIHEQPRTVRDALLGRFYEDEATTYFEEHDFNEISFSDVERIVIIACGSSWHAGAIAAYMIEEEAKIPVKVEIASEFRYKQPLVLPGTLIIAISQSGETADTLAAMRKQKALGAKVLALCNVLNSTLAREADATLFLRAGPEIGVCSTKAFTNQLVLLTLLGVHLARMKGMSPERGLVFIEGLKELPNQVQQVLALSDQIATIAKKYAFYDNFFFLGRHYMFPTGLEGALKIKEIAYINANGYPAGEMKHGPIALITEKCPTVALCANDATFPKLLSNLMEIKARKGLIIAIANGQQELEKVADELIIIPTTTDALSPVLTSVAMQLFAYFVAKERGTPIDQPRNLAKSVTVE